LVALTSRGLALLPVIALASPAAAEGERSLSLSLDFDTFSTPGKKVGSQAPPDVTPDAGGGLTLSYERALGTDLSFRGELAGALYHGGNNPAQMQSALSYAALADVGLVYRFDILKWVPYALVGVGGVISGGGPIDQHGAGDELVVVIGGGLDYLVSRDRSYGFEVKFASFAGDISLTTISFRASTRWGFL
jgi:hypothetical protein